MAHFIGYLSGQAGETSQLGNQSSGIIVRAQGWNLGIRVEGYVTDDGRDAFAIYTTSGSNGSKGDELLQVVEENDERSETQKVRAAYFSDPSIDGDTYRRLIEEAQDADDAKALQLKRSDV